MDLTCLRLVGPKGPMILKLCMQQAKTLFTFVSFMRAAYKVRVCALCSVLMVKLFFSAKIPDNICGMHTAFTESASLFLPIYVIMSGKIRP